MKTDTTIRITQSQYREFAETTKSAAGMALNLSSFKRMGNCWGVVCPGTGGQVVKRYCSHFAAQTPSD